MKSVAPLVVVLSVIFVSKYWTWIRFYVCLWKM